MDSPRRLISVVTPCFNEELTVIDCHEAVKRIFAEQLPQYDYEHIFCDNASTDRTAELLRELAASDPSVKVILNSRNFGPANSLFNGILSASGDAVLTMLPADLQDPPELLPTFVKHWEEGYEVVYGIRQTREESRLKAGIRRVYYRLVKRFANVSIPPDVGEFQLVDKCVIQALRQFDDYYPYIRGMIASCGFRSIGVPFTWKARKRGFSKATSYLMIDQGLNGLISFSKVPMRLCLLGGFLLAGLSMFFALFAFIANVVCYQELAPPGIPTLIVGLFFLSGLQFFFLGMLGEYVLAIHFQVRKRPLVIERCRLNFGTPSSREPPSQQQSAYQSNGLQQEPQQATL
jgi:glycosyltransferase involved in cell wall biosynthesis